MANRLNICEFCQSEDFGYCGLRDSKIKIEFKYDENGNLIQCSEFGVDESKVNRMFKCQKKEADD